MGEGVAGREDWYGNGDEGECTHIFSPFIVYLRYIFLNRAFLMTCSGCWRVYGKGGGAPLA